MSDLMTRAVIMMPLDLAMSSELSRLQFHSRAQDVLRERDTYRELCGELLNTLRTTESWLEGWASAANELAQTRSAITKAEKLLGENNAT